MNTFAEVDREVTKNNKLSETEVRQQRHQILAEIIGIDGAQHLIDLRERVGKVGNDDDEALLKLSDFVHLPQGVSPAKIRTYLCLILGEENLPPYAVASAISVMGKDYYLLGLDKPKLVKLRRNISPEEMYELNKEGLGWLIQDFDFVPRIIVENLLLNTVCPEARWASRLQMYHSIATRYFKYVADNQDASLLKLMQKPVDKYAHESDNPDGINTYYWPFSFYLNDLLQLGYISASRAINDFSCEGTPQSTQFMFKAKAHVRESSRAASSTNAQVQKLKRLKKLLESGEYYLDYYGRNFALFERRNRAHKEYKGYQYWSDAFVSLLNLMPLLYLEGKYQVLHLSLSDLRDGTNSPFKAFGSEAADSLLRMLDYDLSILELNGDSVEDLKEIDVQIQPIVRLENHWRNLNEAWKKVSHLSMNPPVLEHRGAVLADYGRLRPDFVDRMFRQIDTEFGSAYTDEQRAEYTRMMCEGIEGGMSLTGTGRVEYPFWKSVLTRMNGDGVQDIIHVDSGASLGLVDLEIWSDERTGSGALAGRVKKVFAVDRIPKNDLLDRVYEFNQKQYDQTLKLLSVDEARRKYDEAQSQFSRLHPKAEFEHLTADTTADFNDLPAELRELEGKVTLFTDMRANFLHGKPEDREKVFRNAEVLLAEGGRAYFQRGLPIYGDLVLGAVYKKISGKMEVEALQLNKQGESVTVWRLNERGELEANWEEQLRQVLDT